MNFVKPDFKAAGPSSQVGYKGICRKASEVMQKELITDVSAGPVKLELGGKEYEITEFPRCKNFSKGWVPSLE